MASSVFQSNVPSSWLCLEFLKVHLDRTCRKWTCVLKVIDGRKWVAPPFWKTGPSDSLGLGCYFTGFLARLRSWLRANFPVKKVRLFQILCLTWMHIKLRDGVIVPSVCNSVIPGEAVLHPYLAAPSSGVLAMWKKKVDFFQPLALLPGSCIGLHSLQTQWLTISS